MNAPNTIELLKKWNKEYPTACKQLAVSIDIIDKQLGTENIPPDMLAEFHIALGQDIIAHTQSDTNHGELEQIRFERLNKVMEFSWCGKRYAKMSNDFAGQKPNCKCLDTDTFHKFKPDDICLIPAKFVRYQNAVAC